MPVRAYPYSANMADSTAPQLDPEDVDTFVYYAGHYATAVAKHLITEGVAPTVVDVDTPHIHLGKVSEGEAWVYPPRELCARLSPIAEAVLTWDEISGWSATVYQDDDNGDKRWLGHGLVPAPERVAVFLTSVQVDFGSAGSEERPYYRNAGAPYDDVFERLAPYAPPEDSPRPWQNSYDRARSEHYEVRALTHLAEPPGARINVPLLPGEIAALLTLLEWAEPKLGGHGTDAILLGLREELTARVSGDGAVDRGVATLARTRLAEIEKINEHLRKQGLL